MKKKISPVQIVRAVIQLIAFITVPALFITVSDDKDKGEIEKLCSAIKGQYCPAILMYTGFFYECPGKKECKLKDFI